MRIRYISTFIMIFNKIKDILFYRLIYVLITRGGSDDGHFCGTGLTQSVRVPSKFYSFTSTSEVVVANR